jgi:hypothetical protein
MRNNPVMLIGAAALLVIWTSNRLYPRQQQSRSSFRTGANRPNDADVLRWPARCGARPSDDCRFFAH